MDIVFVTLVPFEILSDYYNFALAEKKRSMDHRKSFQRKAYGVNGFDTFFSHFSTNFLVFVRICFFHSQKTYFQVFMMKYEYHRSFFPLRPNLMRIEKFFRKFYFVCLDRSIFDRFCCFWLLFSFVM